ncbi:NAD(P)H-dependent oxidoreductase [Chitinibacter mangrovi]|uniref:NAD(P)H-dependent oxidoreductase n=1 Tax=Chitinibacter mangrovi TaxID=3153927 RepID=UPI003D8137F7
MSNANSEQLLDLPQVAAEHFKVPELTKLHPAQQSSHPPRILMLYGSVRERSFSRLLTEEAARLLRAMGAEVKIFNPSGLPLPDDAPDNHPKVQELRELALWCEGMVWTSPERHGAMTGIMKAQIDWIPLSAGAVRPTQGKNARRDAGFRRFAVFQCSEPNARARALDAHDYDPESIIRGKSLSRVR